MENRAASSAAHIYGKNKVSAESFTSGGKAFTKYPADIKQRGDRFFTEGINNTLLHVYIHQPDERLPGVNATFGTEFNRHNTWFDYLDLFTSYLKRCNFMLQQGRYVADVAYFIGEDVPKMTGIANPPLPKGYSFDYINGEVIRERLTVKNGRLFLPDGMNYRLLVLPKLETMRPELLEKIRDLVREGATIMGPPPNRSPSLENYPVADQRIQRIVGELWGDINGTTITSHKFGNGLVLHGVDLSKALNNLKITPDYRVGGVDSTLFIHRSTPNADIYYLSNQQNRPLDFAAEFRVVGRQPEIWDPIDGTMRLLPQFEQKKESTSVALKLDRFQSTFIVFRKTVTENRSGKALNYPKEITLAKIDKPWKVTFDPKMSGPEEPVMFDQLIDWGHHPNEQIKYYSGTAVYTNSVSIRKPSDGHRIYLNLGEANVIAKVKVNGVAVGGAWTAPWRTEITKALRSGNNVLEISVANTWVNRLIGDSMLPIEERRTWANDNPHQPKSILEPSGLKGPVTITAVYY